MLALLLQAATLFPVAPPPVEADAAFRARVAALAAEDTWKLAAVDALRAEVDLDAEFAALAELVRDGAPRQVRLAALLATGSRRAWVDDALYVAGCTRSGEAEALACLLAAAPPRAAWWPALLLRAQDPLAELPVRAGALARLLDGGCVEAWPFVRSVLRTGTALDEPAPWADWKRGGRYELPKRLLVLSLDALLAARGEGPCAFEPNAAWAAQVEQLKALEPRIWGVAPPAPLPMDAEACAQVRALLALDGAREAAALRTYAVLAAGRPEVRRDDADGALAARARQAEVLRPR